MTESATSNPAGSPKVIDTTPLPKDTSDEFERFEKLTATLAHVPKSELDEKRKKA